MVVMLVAVKQILDIAQPETELLNVGGDEIGALLGPAVDQDVAGGIGDQDGRDSAGSDEIGVAEDADRRRGLVVIVPVLALQREFGAGDLDRRARLLEVVRISERNDDGKDLGGGEDQASEHSWRR
jgi:hypothetical protein